MSAQQIRQRIQSEFRRQQLMLDKEALALLAEYVEQAPTGLEAVYTVIDKLEAGMAFCTRLMQLPVHRLHCPVIIYRCALFADNHSRITGPLVQEALRRLGTAPVGAVLLQTFDCFDLPKVRFDNIRQRFYSVKEPLTLHTTAQVHLHLLKAMLRTCTILNCKGLRCRIGFACTWIDSCCCING